jgi:hypothetical protein
MSWSKPDEDDLFVTKEPGFARAMLYHREQAGPIPYRGWMRDKS